MYNVKQVRCITDTTTGHAGIEVLPMTCCKQCVEEVADDFRYTPKLEPNVYGSVSTVLVKTLFLVSAISLVSGYVKCKFCGS